MTQPKAAQTQKSVFQKMDKNNNGKVTTEEHQARLKEWFKELDKNNDGKVTTEEFGGARFVNIDVNKDGFVTVDEITAVAVIPVFAAKAAEKKAGSPAEK